MKQRLSFVAVAVLMCVGVFAQWSKPAAPASVPLKANEALYLYNPDADAFFPEVNWEEWEEVERQEFSADEKNPYPYTFLTYIRKK
jgi:hypothetical protein